MGKRNLLLAVFCAVSLCLLAQMQISPTRYDWSGPAGGIVGDATGKRGQAYRIYRYLCDNIRYDTFRTVHDTDRCYETKSGVCVWPIAKCFTGLALRRITGRRSSAESQKTAAGRCSADMKVADDSGCYVCCLRYMVR